MKKGELTKKTIANAFKSLMETEEYEGITITDITDKCDLNRLTFYYHFKDKIDLLRWIFNDDVVKPAKESISAEDWQGRLDRILDEMYDRKDFYVKIITYERLDVWNYMFAAAEDMMRETVTARNGENSMDEKDIWFVSYFFAFGIAGSIYDWAAKGMQEPPEELKQLFVSLVEVCKQYAYYISK